MAPKLGSADSDVLTVCGSLRSQDEELYVSVLFSILDLGLI